MVLNNVPLGVLKESHCAICWKWFGNGTRWRQTLDDVTRSLCEGCFSRMYPVLPQGMEGSEVVHIDAKGLLKEEQYASDAEAKAGYDAWLDGYQRGKEAAAKTDVKAGSSK